MPPVRLLFTVGSSQSPTPLPSLRSSSRNRRQRIRRPLHRSRRHIHAAESKMHVPGDSFGGRSPERKAADALQTFFTFIAVKVILAQLEGSGRGNLASYNAKAYNDLMQLLESTPMTGGGDEWLAKLLEKNEMLGMRVMEVRASYCQEDFEWEECKKIASREIQESNVRLLRQYADARIGKSTQAHPIWPPPKYD